MDSGKPRVLVVDDHPANRLAFELVLEKDFDVLLAASGAQAVELAARHDFAAILLDVRMPLMDGYETALELRRAPRSRATPIVLTSAYERAPVRALRELALDFIVTPVEPELLRGKIASHARNATRERALRRQIAEMTCLLQSLREQLASTAQAGFEGPLARLDRLSQELKRHAPCPA